MKAKSILDYIIVDPHIIIRKIHVEIYIELLKADNEYEWEHGRNSHGNDLPIEVLKTILK